ncbi:MAG: peptidoglycan DD-metalloendopeptidase family protein [Pseudomonadota bacterium]
MYPTRLSILILLFLLASCGGSRIYVPVFSAGEASRQQHYEVRPGDTLYSIAFRFGLDYKDLARANGISAPYTIFVNQRLRIAGDPDALARADGPPPASSGATRAKPAPVRPTPGKSSGGIPPAPAPVRAPTVADSNIQWRWPYDGEVVNRFSLSGNVNKGIDIRGKAGDSVRSSADGVVVYAGGGLRGYGKLVIVKHNDRYLSAYGHNQSLAVKEGDKVSAGQVVARIGGPNGDKDLLYFEIRRDGKPQDPLAYLPSQQASVGSD